jgi:hypothetical protein
MIGQARPGLSRRSRETIGIMEAPETPIRAVMLERLGPTVWHESTSAAMAALEELEETARVSLLSGRSIAPLTEAQIAELRQAFGARW